MSYAKFLADSSAVFRLLHDSEARRCWGQVLDAGMVATCPITELELLFGARSKADRDRRRQVLRDTFGWVVMPERVFEQAIEVQVALTDRGSHRSAGPVDLLTAATAAAHRLVLLHYDADFEQVASVTGQPVRWLMDPGSIS